MSNPRIRQQAAIDAKPYRDRRKVISFALSTQELSNLIDLSGAVARAHNKGSVSLSQLCAFVASEGYVFIDGTEAPYSNSHYSDPENSTPLLAKYGLEAHPQRRTVPAKLILELEAGKRSAFLAEAQEWERKHNLEIAQFNVSLKPSAATIERLREIHYRHVDCGSDAFNSPGRALKLIVRDYHQKLAAKYGSEQQHDQHLEAYHQTLQAICQSKAQPVCRADITFMVETIPKVGPAVATATLEQLVAALIEWAQLEKSEIIEQKTELICLIAALCVMRVESILVADDIISCTGIYRELLEKELQRQPRKRFKHSLHLIASYIPAAWFRQPENQVSKAELKGLQSRALSGSKFLIEILNVHPGA